MDINRPQIPSFAAKLKKKVRNQILTDAVVARNQLFQNKELCEADFKALPIGMILSINLSPKPVRGQLRISFDEWDKVSDADYGLRIGYDAICQEYPVSRIVLASSVTPSLCPAFKDMLESGFGHREMQSWMYSVYLTAAAAHHGSSLLLSEFTAWRNARGGAAAENTVH